MPIVAHPRLQKHPPFPRGRQRTGRGVVNQGLTRRSRGWPKGCAFCPPLTSNVRRHEAPMNIELQAVTSSHVLNPRIAVLLGPHLTMDVLRAIEVNGGVIRTITKEGDPIGIVSVMREGELMVAIDKDHRRQGIASAAVAKIAEIVFKDRAMPKIAFCTQLSSASANMAMKLGALETGRSESEITFEVTAQLWRAMTSVGKRPP